MQESTALLVLGWEVRAGDAPVAGKVYEYVGAGRPVLVCAPASYEARRLVEDTGTGIGAWDDQELATALDRLAQFEVAPEARRSFSRKVQAARALAIFEEVVRRPPR
jgi:hypothetical protein